MARGGNVKVRFGADTSDLQRGTRKAETSLDRMEKSGSKSLGALKTAGLAAGAALAGGLVIGATKSAQAAIEAEKANARLEAQLKASGISYRRHEDQIKRVIDAHSRLSGFDDEDLGDSFTNIVRIVGDVDKALELNTLAMDFARAKHMEVAKAGELVGKVAGGNTGILSRYGLAVKPVTDAQDALAKTTGKVTVEQRKAAVETDKQATVQAGLAALQQKFSGQAEKYGKTTAGAVDRSKVAFENLGETIGAHVTPIIARVAEGFSELVRQITLGEGPGGRIRTVFEGIAAKASAAYGTVSSLAGGFQRGEAGARALASGLGALVAGFVAFKVISTAVAGVTALRAAWVGLTAAIAANPLGAVAIAAAAAAAAFGIFSIRTRSASADSRELNNALRAQADALREVRDIDVDVAQRKANLQSATVGVEQAERRLKDLRKDGKASALDIRQAEADLKQARVAQTRAQRDLGDAETDAKRKREDATRASEEAKRETRELIKAREAELKKTNEQIRALESSGEKYLINGRSADDYRQKAKGLRTELARLKSKDITVSVRLDFDAAMNASPGSDAAQGDGPGIKSRVVSGVKASASRLFTKAFPTGPFSGGLDGADADLGPFAAIGSRFGLGVSSGLRPGAVTSSGNPSFHGTGDAVDLSGPPGGMMKTFQFLKAAFGSRLRELIYTPGGVGIKDGKPFTYTGKVAADHFDHVHVAYTGPFGDGPGRKKGDGLGRFDATSYGPPWGGIQGTGVTATGVNLKSNPHMYGVAVDPSRIPLGSKLKITPNPFGTSSAFTAFDTGGAIKGNRIDFYDWRGRATQNKWGHRSVSVSTVGGKNGKGGVVSVPDMQIPVGKAGRGRPGTPATGLAPGSERGGFIVGGGGAEYDLARTGVKKAKAESRDDLSGFVKALQEERAIKRRRLKRVRKALKGRLSKKNRIRLSNEEAQLIGEIGDLNDTIKEYQADAAAGATTISRADELDAGVDTSAADASGGDGGGGTPEPDPALELANRLAAEANDLRREQIARQDRILALAGQGPAILAAVVAAVNGGIGGPTALGFSVPGYPGGGVRY